MTSQASLPRVLVTGARGFTGQYVCAALAGAGYEVCEMEFGSGQACTSVKVDLTNSSQVLRAIETIRPQAVIHLAAVAFVGHSNPDAFYKVNLLGTRNLLDALVHTNSGKEGVILASSANVYGTVRTEDPIGEDTPPNPANEYAVSKLAMEYMARLWFDLLPIVITRPFNYTGIGQSEQFLVPKIVSHFRRREKVIELGNLNVRREFNDVRYVARLYVELLRARPWGQAINICSGKTYSIENILSLCKIITGHTIDVIQRNNLMRKNEISILQGDVSKLQNTVKEHEQILFEETLEWMLTS